MESSYNIKKIYQLTRLQIFYICVSAFTHKLQGKCNLSYIFHWNWLTELIYLSSKFVCLTQNEYFTCVQNITQKACNFVNSLFEWFNDRIIYENWKFIIKVKDLQLFKLTTNPPGEDKDWRHLDDISRWAIET